MSYVNLFSVNKKSGQQGFTLVEIMVAVSIFTIVVTIGMGALLAVNNAYKKTKDRRQAVASVSSAIEYLMREMRTGYSFTCNNYQNTVLVPGTSNVSTDCFPPTNPSQGITFLDQDRNQQVIYLNTSSTVGRIYKNTFAAGLPGQPVPITDPSIVDIEDLNFYLKGVADDPQTFVYVQPVVVVQIKGKVVGQANSDFTFQSTISQRLLDVSPNVI